MQGLCPARKRYLMALCGFAIVLALMGGAAADTLSKHPAADGSDIPAQLKNILPALQNRAAADIAALNAAEGDDWAFAFRLFLYQQTTDYRDGQSPTWLVGYESATAGKSLVWALELITASGDRIAKFPAYQDHSPDGVFRNGFVTKLASNKWALVVSYFAGRRSGSTVDVLSLPESNVLFHYDWNDGKNGEAYVAVRESTLYFTDTNSDGSPDILIDRDRLDTVGSRTHEQLLFRFNPATGSFVGETVPADQLASYVSAARANPNVPRIAQNAPPDNPNISGSSAFSPTISSFSPGSGPPGSAVNITGTNLAGTSLVDFGGGIKAVFGVTSDTNLSATVPTAAVTGKIELATTYGFVQSATNFTVVPGPAITSFSPTSGWGGSSMAQPGTRVTITGQRFTGATDVRFAGTAGVNKTVDSDTQISVTAPGGAITGKITVTTPSGTAASATDFTIVPRPTDSIPPTPPPADG